MAQGRLSGKYFRRQPVWQEHDNRTHNTRGDDYRRYAVLEAFLPEGCTMAQAAIRSILDDPDNHSICMGAKNLEDYEAAMEACDLPPLGPDVTRQLRDCAARLGNG